MHSCGVHWLQQRFLTCNFRQKCVIDHTLFKWPSPTASSATARVHAHQPLGLCRFTKTSGLMAVPDTDTDMQEAMTALTTLISGRQRKDGRTWETAFDYMKVYLEVCPAPLQSLHASGPGCCMVLMPSVMASTLSEKVLCPSGWDWIRGWTH